jgi:hypothetical protein
MISVEPMSMSSGGRVAISDAGAWSGLISGWLSGRAPAYSSAAHWPLICT